MDYFLIALQETRFSSNGNIDNFFMDLITALIKVPHTGSLNKPFAWNY